MALDSELLLINRADVDSGNDGNGSGADETTAAGAVVNVPEGAHLAVVMALGEPGATVAGDSDTLDVICQMSPDGGSTYGPAFTFRQFLGSEVNSIDESSGSVGLIRAGYIVTPIADSDQSGVILCRLNIIVSTTEHFSLYIDLRDPGNCREEWFDDAFVA